MTRPLAIGVLVLTALLSGGTALSGCAGAAPGGVSRTGPAPLRGFGVDVDTAVAPRIPTVHLQTCGPWGCHEQDVALLISGPTSAAPCPTGPTTPEGSTCGPVQLPGPGPGYGYAPVPPLTFDPVTVTVTTPTGAALPVNARITVRPAAVCPGRGPAEASGTDCPDATPQAQLRIGADGTVSQSR
jgi:hypothetical protein